MFRHPDLADQGESDESSIATQARRAGLFYHKHSGGNIGQYGYGAGVAMSTMDALAIAGGKVRILDPAESTDLKLTCFRNPTASQLP